ncbi:MAG: TetR/AcrR family transcriptional regulator [Dermatophilus congolensis]|nr:TetR/AcrR family transcriptional regulator [Dermatophilus congolensis]
MSIEPTDQATRRPGGRTARTRAAVQEASLRLLAERGFTFGMEELAGAAGVHKTTLYRRWPSMGALLADVTGELISSDVPIPDTGSLEGDLRAVAGSIRQLMSHPIHGPALTALSAAPAAITEVTEVLTTFWASRLKALEPLVARARARGEVPAQIDTALIFETLGAPLYYRLLITRRAIDDDAIERAVAVTMASIRADLLH